MVNKVNFLAASSIENIFQMLTLGKWGLFPSRFHLLCKSFKVIYEN